MVHCINYCCLFAWVSWNQKRDWVQCLPGVILNELGHGGSWDRKRGCNVGVLCWWQCGWSVKNQSKQKKKKKNHSNSCINTLCTVIVVCHIAFLPWNISRETVFHKLSFGAEGKKEWWRKIWWDEWARFNLEHFLWVNISAQFNLTFNLTTNHDLAH